MSPPKKASLTKEGGTTSGQIKKGKKPILVPTGSTNTLQQIDTVTEESENTVLVKHLRKRSTKKLPYVANNHTTGKSKKEKPNIKIDRKHR